MIRSALFVLGAAFALPAFAQGAAGDTSASGAKAKDPNRKICEKVERIGSRLATTKVCMTAAEWEELRRNHREDFEKVQRVVNTSPGN